MSSRKVSVFAVARSVFDHEFFATEAFTEREAWIWLLAQAAWRPTRVRVGAVLVDLDRGQCAFSLRFMADKWGWSKSRVDRFLMRLKIETMIGTAAGQGATVITLCNYAHYQKVSLPTIESGGTTTGTAAGQQRDKEESRETTEGRDVLAKAKPSPAPLDSSTDPKSLDPTTGSFEDRYWALADRASEKGIARSLMGKLAQLLNGDFERGIGIITDAMNARAARPYLTKIMRNIEVERAPLTVMRQPGIPDWVIDARAQGYPVQREDGRWRMAGALFDDEGEQVGN